MIVQLGVTTGPADWELLVVAPLIGSTSWSWTAWLPQSCVDGTGDPITYEEVEAVSVRSSAGGERERRLIVVVDGAAPLGRTSPLRRLATRAQGVDDARGAHRRAAQLPAVCEVVVEVAATGDVVVLEPGVVPRRA